MQTASEVVFYSAPIRVFGTNHGEYLPVGIPMSRYQFGRSVATYQWIFCYMSLFQILTLCGLASMTKVETSSAFSITTVHVTLQLIPTSFSNLCEHSKLQFV